MEFEVPRRKQLNPELFGETKNHNFVDNSSSQQTLPHLMQVEQRVLDLKTQIVAVIDHVTKLTTNFNEHVKRSSLKFEQVQTVLQQLQQNDQILQADTSQRLSQIHMRVGDRKMFEEKVQELIDRHQQVLKSFEMRISGLQNILAEKEHQFMQAQAALNEAKMEIARLKRL